MYQDSKVKKKDYSKASVEKLMLQILTLVFAFILKTCFDFIYIKLAAHAFTVELSFTSIREVGRGVFICPLLETQRKYYSTVSTVIHAQCKNASPPPPYRKPISPWIQQLHAGWILFNVLSQHKLYLIVHRLHSM